MLTPLVTALYALFGEYAFWLNATVVLMGLGAVLIWTRLAAKYDSAALGIGAAIVFVCAPPSWNYFATKFWASHTESVFFSAVQVAVAFAVVRRRSGALAVAGWGLLAGACTLFSLHNVVTLPATWLFWATAVGRKETLRRTPAFAAGVLCGFAPSIAIHASLGKWYGYYLASWSGGGSIGAALAEAAGKVHAFFAVVLPNLADYPAPWMSAVWIGMAVIGMAVLAIGLIRARKSAANVESGLPPAPIARIVLLLSCCYLVVYLAGPMAVEQPANPFFYRYVLPLFPPLMIAIAAAFARFRAPGLVALGVLAFFAQAQTPFPGQWRGPADAIARAREVATGYRGHDMRRLWGESTRLAIGIRPHNEQPAAYARVLSRVPKPERWLACREFGRWAQPAARDGETLSVPAACTGALAEFVAEGFAAAWTMDRVSRDDPVDEPAAFAWDRALPDAPADTPAVRAALARGTGFGLSEALLPIVPPPCDQAPGDLPRAGPAWAVNRWTELDETEREAFATGAGRRFGLEPPAEADLFCHFPAFFPGFDRYAGAFFAGVAQGIAEAATVYRNSIRRSALASPLRESMSISGVDPGSDAKAMPLITAGLAAIGMRAAPIADPDGADPLYAIVPAE